MKEEMGKSYYAAHHSSEQLSDLILGCGHDKGAPSYFWLPLWRFLCVGKRERCHSRDVVPGSMADTIALSATPTTLYSYSTSPQKMWRQLWTQVTFWQGLKCCSAVPKVFQEVFESLILPSQEIKRAVKKKKILFSYDRIKHLILTDR